MAQKICIVSDHHLCTNPRVWKEANTLVNAGYEVVILTVFSNEHLLKRDNELLDSANGSISYIAAVSFIPSDISFVKKVLYKSITKAAYLLKRIGVDTIYLLNSAPKTIFRKAKELNADLYICHIDCSLYVGQKLIKSGERVAFDLEDWYSRDYLVPSRPVNMLANLERYAMQNGRYVSCPSHAMADALNEAYGAKRPIVLYNSFPQKPIKYVDKDNKAPSLVWFSQTIGPGRGLEKVLCALHHVDIPVRIVLVGDCKAEYKQLLYGLLPTGTKHSLEVLPQVKYNELHDFLCGFDIGLALEEKTPDNKEKTISNKIFQYLQAGLKVLATNTDGQQELAEHFPEAITIVDADSLSDWPTQLSTLIVADADKKAIADKYNAGYSWETQEPELLKHVDAALK